MNVATIDIGTNTALLLVASIDEAGNISTLVYEQRVPRLGRGVDAQRLLRPEAISKVVEAVSEYAGMIDRFDVARVAVCGTSAVRDAANSEELISAIRSATGFVLEPLSGSEEAVWTYRGAISGLGPVEHAVVIDIGGGSTEITVGTGSAIATHLSMDIGSVRLTERVLLHDPPAPAEIERARSIIREHFSGVPDFRQPHTRCVGVAGTVTTLALLANHKRSFSVADISNAVLRRQDVDRVFDRITQMPARDIRSLSDYMEGRADIILAGTIILQEVMNLLACSEITVSERGLRYGIALREWERRGMENGERRAENS